MTYTRRYLDEARSIIDRLDSEAIERLADLLVSLRERGGRLFVLGLGGGAANASHAAADFRKLAGIEAYAPTDSAAEVTARANDEGWAAVFTGWLRDSRLKPDDLLLIFSVGGGDVERNVSPGLVTAMEYARRVGAGVAGVVGRDGGCTARMADVCVLVPTADGTRVTPHTEAFQALIWHLLVSHPQLKVAAPTWES
jgi:D-sedoheptulose 7-phosphate isomerase